MGSSGDRQRIAAAKFLLASGALALLAATGYAQEATPIFVELNSPEPTAVARYQAASAGQPFDADLHRASVRLAQDNFLSDLTAAGIAYTLTNTSVLVGGSTVAVPDRYTELINAVRLEVAGLDVARIRAHPNVRQITVDVPLRLILNNSVPYIRANGPNSARSLGLRGSGQINADGSSTGQVIAVLDSGIDHTNPMFDARFDDAQFEQRSGDLRPVRLQGAPFLPGQNHPKVVYRFLFSTAPVEGDDLGHGTNVASTAAGLKARADTILNKGEIVEGVAPGALLMDYKVCPSLNCVGAQILLALDDAARERDLAGFPKPRATVVNMSFGDDDADPNSGGNPNSAFARAAGNLQFLGVFPEASAGNSGPGENTIGSPAAGRLVVATAATTDPGNSPNSIDVLETDRITVKAGTPKILAFFAPESNGGKNITSPVVENYVFAGFADTPDQVPDQVKGRICLTERGSTVTVAGQGSGLFALKATNCAAKGAIAVVVFNNRPGQIGAILAPSAIPVFSISREDGLFLRDVLGFDANGISKFPIRINPEDPALFVPDTAGFSSRGPNNDFKVIKPDITAPGVEILMGASKVGALGSPTGFASASGTSFSGPHVSGAAALARDAQGGRPDFSPSMVRAALMNSSTNLRERDNVTPIPDNDDRVFVHETGAGLTEMVRAIGIRALMGTNDQNGTGGPDLASDPNFLPSHSFGQQRLIGTGLPASDPRQRRTITVTLKDVSGAGGSYTLSVVDAGALRGDVTRPLDTPGFSLTLSQTSLSVPPNGSATFDVTVAVDGTSSGLQIAGTDNTGAEATEFLWYVVASRSDGSESLRMPFYLRVARGVAGGGAVGSTAGGGWIARGDNKANFAFNAEATSPPVGRINYDDSQQGVGLKGTVSAISVSGNKASFSGPCTLRDGSACQYTVEVEDNAEPGKGADRFLIRWSSGSSLSEASGLLGGGNIQVSN